MDIIKQFEINIKELNIIQLLELYSKLNDIEVTNDLLCIEKQVLINNEIENRINKGK